jgi:hypothetical protein
MKKFQVIFTVYLRRNDSSIKILKIHTIAQKRHIFGSAILKTQKKKIIIGKQIVISKR